MTLNKGNIVSVASADVHVLHKNAEITDCATNTEYREKGLMSIIIKNLEEEV